MDWWILKEIETARCGGWGGGSFEDAERRYPLFSQELENATGEHFLWLDPEGGH